MLKFLTKRNVISAVFCGVMLFSMTQKSFAADAAPVILLVDVQETLQNSEAGKQVRKQLDEKQVIFQKEIEKSEAELKQMEQDLLRQRTVLSQEVFAEKKKEFDNKMMDLNKNFQNQRQILDKAFGTARGEMMNEVLTIIAEFKKEKNANIVLNAQQVVMSDQAMNVTNEVLARFNKKMPTYKVKF